jgi:CheY-like chemotaxis protein
MQRGGKGGIACRPSYPLSALLAFPTEVTGNLGVFDQVAKRAMASATSRSAAHARAVMPKKILVADNEIRSRHNVADFLREQNYEVDEADDGVTALALLETKSFDLLICDIVMPRLSAFDVIDRMKALSLSPGIILITGHPDLIAQKGLENLPCFTKPFNLYDLLQKVREMTGQ